MGEQHLDTFAITAPQQTASLFDHLVGAGEQRWPESTRTIYLVIT
jgi:hypothetical protein